MQQIRKGAAIVLLATIVIASYLRPLPVEVPVLPNEYWGPGKPEPDPMDIRPFKINISKEVIEDLHFRLDATRMNVQPLQSTAWTYGFPSTYLERVLRYWKQNYDWGLRQTLLNKYPQFITKIQGLDIHFYHIKPKIPKNRQLRILPMLMLHGWPGSVVEFQRIILLLSQPQPDKDFVFELVIPSLPGYGFSKPAVRPGLGPSQMAVVFKNLMLRLGFEKFYTQGGDLGSLINSNLAVLFPNNVIGLHLNTCMVMTLKAQILTLLGAYIPFVIVDKSRYSWMYPMTRRYKWLIQESGYVLIQATKPDTVGIGLTDSPAGLAAYILEKFNIYTNPQYKFRDDGGFLQKFSMDELLDNLMIYWATNSITTSQRLHAESFSKNNRNLGIEEMPVKVPTGCTAFPYEIIYQPVIILRERYRNLIYFTHQPRGGHFAALEEPDLLAADIWKFVLKNEKLIAEKNKQKNNSNINNVGNSSNSSNSSSTSKNSRLRF